MPTIIDCPTMVQDAIDGLGAVFAHAPERRHVAESLPGLMVAAPQTVRGISRACVVTPDQSGVHRWRNAVAWDVKALNARGLAWWQGAPKTRDSLRGVMALGHPLVDQAGTLLADVGGGWDHASERSGMVHASRLSHEVCPSGAPSPIAWRRCKHSEAGQQGACSAPTALGSDRITEAMACGIPGACTCDRYGPSAQGRNHLARTTRASVGALQRTRTLVYAGRAQALRQVARPMPGQAKHPVRVGHRRAWYVRQQRRIPAVHHPVRRVLLWQERADAAARPALGSPRRLWAVMRMV